ncbi:hypothetical protein G7046_g9562 [Stylonectria norvegica]|nr:hypothetical protein G7046_g9562 [Stylonectria norvegica]
MVKEKGKGREQELTKGGDVTLGLPVLVVRSDGGGGGDGGKLCWSLDPPSLGRLRLLNVEDETTQRLSSTASTTTKASKYIKNPTSPKSQVLLHGTDGAQTVSGQDARQHTPQSPGQDRARLKRFQGPGGGPTRLVKACQARQETHNDGPRQWIDWIPQGRSVLLQLARLQDGQGLVRSLAAWSAEAVGANGTRRRSDEATEKRHQQQGCKKYTTRKQDASASNTTNYHKQPPTLKPPSESAAPAIPELSGRHLPLPRPRPVRAATPAMAVPSASDEPPSPSEELWRHPDPAGTPMWKFLQHVNHKYGLQLDGYPDLYAWSVSNVALFWEEVWHFVGVTASTPFDQV